MITLLKTFLIDPDFFLQSLYDVIVIVLLRISLSQRPLDLLSRLVHIRLSLSQKCTAMRCCLETRLTTRKLVYVLDYRGEGERNNRRLRS